MYDDKLADCVPDNAYQRFFLTKHFQGVTIGSIREQFISQFPEASAKDRFNAEDGYEQWLHELEDKAKEHAYVAGFDLTAAKLADDEFGARLLHVLSDGAKHVWRARSMREWLFRGDLVVKILRRSDNANAPIPTTMLGRFLLRELQTLRGISHPHVVRVYDGFFSPHNDPWLALEFVDGCDLRKWKESFCSEGLPLRSALAIVGFFADVLQQIAERASASDTSITENTKRSSNAFIHGDIKPSNIVGCPKEKLTELTLDTMKLCDFGTALLETAADAESRVRQKQYGTCGFMAPEQFMATERTSAIDTFAFGMMLLSLLSPNDPQRFCELVGDREKWRELHSLWFHKSSSRAPFEDILCNASNSLPPVHNVHDTFAQLELPKLVDALIPGADIHVQTLRAIVKTCVAVDPTKRFKQSGDVAELFAAWLRDEEVDIDRMQSSLSPSDFESLNTGTKKWLSRDRRLIQRIARWRDDDDISSAGAFAWIGCAAIVCGTAIWQMIWPIGMYMQTVVTIYPLALMLVMHAIQFGRFIAAGAMLDSKLILKAVSTWAIIIGFVITFLICRAVVGDFERTDLASQRADVAQMILTFCLLMGYVCGRGGTKSISIIFGCVACLVTAVVCSFCTPDKTYERLAGIAFFSIYGIYMWLFIAEQYFVPILLNRRPIAVRCRLETADGRAEIFKAVVVRVDR